MIKYKDYKAPDDNGIGMADGIIRACKFNGTIYIEESKFKFDYKNKFGWIE